MMVPPRSGLEYPVRNTRRPRPGARWSRIRDRRILPLCLLFALGTASDGIAQPGGTWLFTAPGESPGNQHGFAIAGTPGVYAAQEANSTNQPAWRRFTLIVSVAPVVGGPATSLVEQLEEAGFDDVSPGYVLGLGYPVPIAHPVENDDRMSLALTARYALTRDWALGAGFASTDLGGATGYQADPADPDALGERIESVWSGKQFWLAAFWTPTDWFRIGGGPGAYFLTSDDSVGDEIDVTRFGATLETGAVSPNLGWFVVDFGVRLHLIPATDVETSTYSSASSVTLRPEWTHVEFAFGIGIRP